MIKPNDLYDLRCNWTKENLKEQIIHLKESYLLIIQCGFLKRLLDVKDLKSFIAYKEKQIKGGKK